MALKEGYVENEREGKKKRVMERKERDMERKDRDTKEKKETCRKKKKRHGEKRSRGHGLNRAEGEEKCVERETD